MKTKITVAISVLALGLIVSLTKLCEATPIGTAFTYQGYVYDANYPANNFYDFQFKLCDALVGGSQVGSDFDAPDVDVVDGAFTVGLDFGSSVFAGDARWLEIAIRPGDSEDRYTTLSPRQEITPTPYALYAQIAGNAGNDNDWMVSGNDLYTIPSGNVGIGTTTPGAKLEVNGPVKITDGTQGAGKVLTSDASGLASWQTPSTGSETSYWSCVGAHFQPQYNTSSTTEINRDGAYIKANTNGIFFFAPVMLPHGATVTKVVVYGSPASESWALRRITLVSYK